MPPKVDACRTPPRRARARARTTPTPPKTTVETVETVPPRRDSAWALRSAVSVMPRSVTRSTLHRWIASPTKWIASPRGGSRANAGSRPHTSFDYDTAELPAVGERMYSHSDRPFSGRTSPLGIDVEVFRQAGGVEAHLTLGSAHEGAPGPRTVGSSPACSTISSASYSRSNARWPSPAS